MRALAHDVRFALRSFRRNPGFVAMAVLVLALGIGANSAMFSVVDAVMLRPLPYGASDQLLVVGRGRIAGRPGRGTASWPTFRDWRSHSRSVRDMAAYHGGVVALTGAGVPELIPSIASTANLFDLLGVRPALGRGFAAGEDQPGRNRVVVLSDGLWRRRFGADPGMVGRMITLDGASHTVIGVAGPGFNFPPTEHAGQLWVPVPQGNLDVHRHDRSLQTLQVVGRLAPGASLASAQAELQTIHARLARQHPEDRAATGVLTATSLQTDLTGNVRVAMFTLLAAVAAVLLIACANVANLMLARSAVRGRELAIRAALGAGRGRIVRQLLTESACLGIMGGALGLALALWGLELLVSLIPSTVPRPHQIAVDGRVLLFTAVVALGTSVGFGIVPALSASAGGARPAMKLGGRGAIGGRGRLRSALLTAEIAISFLLLVGAGLALRSFARVATVDAGFDSRDLLTASVSLPANRYPWPEGVAAFYGRLLPRVAALPGVQGAALAMPLPFSASNINLPFAVPGRPAPTPGERSSSPARFVSPDYFAVLGIPLVRGRLLQPADDLPGAAPVTVVSESFARLYFPDEDPVGKAVEVTVAFPGVRRIVGVVRDVRRRLDEASAPQLYLTFHQPTAQVPLPVRTLIVRSRAGVSAIAPLRAELANMDAGLPLGEVTTMDDLVARSLQQRRLSATLLALFAGLALALAAAGIYGVMSYTVAQQTRELGLRMALGAPRGRVLTMVLGKGLRLGVLGLALGLVAALAFTRVLTSQLYEISATDPPTFVVIGVLLLAVAALATLLPARRATRVDPLIALSHE
jgi:putative ABC transport system permease protein